MENTMTTITASPKQITNEQPKTPSPSESEMVRQAVAERGTAEDNTTISTWIKVHFHTSISPERVAKIRNKLWKKDEAKRQAAITFAQLRAVEAFFKQPSAEAYGNLWLVGIEDTQTLLSTLLKLQRIKEEEVERKMAMGR